MTMTAEEIMTDGGHNLPLERDLRDALSTYARRTWPRDTAKSAARAWGVPLSTAQNILKGHASAATITHVIRTAGWSLATVVIGAVIGQSLEAFVAAEKTRIRRERQSFESQHERLVEMARHLRASPSLGAARARRMADEQVRDRL